MMFNVRRLIVMMVVASFSASSFASGQQIERNPKTSQKAMVVSVEPAASGIGVAAMLYGGNAIDAAVAVAMTLAVTHPEAGNIGGGGFMVVYIAKTKETFTVDFRETAPKLAHAKMFLDENGNIDKKKSDIGWLTVGTPGSVAGLWAAHKKAGKLPWRDLFEGPISLCRDGVFIDEYLARGLAKQEKDFRALGEAGKVYLDANGKAPRVGTRWKLPDLEKTLRLIALNGPDGFYKGSVADLLDKAMRENGGLLRKEDLAAYTAKIREPVKGTYRGYDIVGMPPPSSGGITMIQMLNILEGFDLSREKAGSPHMLHLLSETMRQSFYQRAVHIGDPDFVQVPVEKLTSKQFAETLRKAIGEKAGSSQQLGAEILSPPEKFNTTHFSIVDGEGNAVSCTTTLEDAYGAKVIAPGTGFLLNNEMHDFNLKQGYTSTDGRIGTPPNAIEPGKRMLSSMTPTIVLKDGKPILVVGSPGGRTIINTVFETVVNVIDHKMEVQAAVDAPRIHHQWMPDRIVMEGSFDPAVEAALKALGHQVVRRGQQGDCHAIWIDPKTGLRHAGVDRRLRGASAGF